MFTYQAGMKQVFFVQGIPHRGNWVMGSVIDDDEIMKKLPLKTHSITTNQLTLQYSLGEAYILASLNCTPIVQKR